MGKYVNKSELAEILGKSERTLTTWQKNGMPISVDGGGRGYANTYDTAEVIDWLLRNELEKHLNTDQQVLDYDYERARLTHNQANKVEMENAVMRGDLIPAELVEDVQNDMIGRARARLLAIPTKAAPQLISELDIGEVQDILKKLVYEALRELAEYDPEDFGIVLTVEDPLEGMEPTA